LSALPLRVALLHFAYWPEVRRGSERMVHDLAVGLHDRGQRPRILTSHPGRPTRSVEDGVPVVRAWRAPDRLLRRRRFPENLTHVPFSYLELQRGDDEIAHAFHAADGLAATRWSRTTGRPAVFSLMGEPRRETISNLRLRMRIHESVLDGAAAVTALSESAAGAARRWLGLEPRVIYPGVDLRAFTPGTRAPEPTIACAATPDDPRKQVGLLVDAFALLRKDVPDARLLLMRPAREELARRFEAVEGVELVAGDSDVVAEVFRTAWASALCSRQEAFGLVLVESLACGTPVVGARDGAIPEVVDRPEIGRLFEADDEREVARALRETIELAADPATAAACRSRAEDFSIGRTAAAHENLYRELLAG
jgi:glycosyltransferase involved in cell wall biosynthesis